MIDAQAPHPATDATAATQATAEQAHPWADLDPEHFRLLRLAPLPVDRHTGARPLRFVQLGRVERHSKGQSLLRLTLHLPGLCMRREQNLLEVWLDHRNQEMRFGPEKGLQLEPANRGLGRFLLAQGIAWAQQHCAHYQVEGAALPAKDALNADARLRRDHCLQAQGLVIEYLDPLQLKARYGAARVSSLHNDWHSEKVQIVDLLDAAAMLQQADQSLREQDIKLRKQESRIELLRREDGSLRFTIACLVAFCLFQAGLLIWMATR
ncbi:hypothetical protein P8H27_12595 [Pseudomonas sp. sp1636]|uniref:hypothetical protein n=1 Tax=Pseudomonas sp. sp1636 TaxID=3036707 RepID=UPI0025A636AF|nr:hypothetical protein [Pseudomonas sp. sp1636]MDM8349726.1 hypothetical protein [Pseudomonas sp. sp1636]